MRRSISILTGISLLLMFGCSDLGIPIISPVDHGNFVLYVTNQSWHVDPVDVQVYIDESRAVNQQFQYGTGHTFVRFEFQVQEGSHTLHMSSTHVQDVQSMEFVLSSTPYAVVAFWSAADVYYEAGGDPPHFDVWFSPNQPSWN